MDPLALFLFIIEGIMIILALIIGIWKSKNNIIIQIFEKKHGSIFVRSIKVRKKFIKRYNKFFYVAQNDFKAKKPLSLDINIFENYQNRVESMPFIGPKYRIKILKVKGEYMPFSPPVKLPKYGLVSPYSVAWVDESLEHVYKVTSIDSPSEVIRKILLPAGAIILAVVMIIFLPEFYDKIGSAKGTDILSFLEGTRNLITTTVTP